MVKHTHIIHPPLPTNSLSVFDHFVVLVPKGLINHFWKYIESTIMWDKLADLELLIIENPKHAL